MKRTYANEPKSSKIIGFKYDSKTIDREEFRGYLGKIDIERVAQPVNRMIGDHMLTLGDVGYTWLQTFPKNKNYSITTMFDQEDKIIEWYVDIIKNVDLDERGIPFYDDLYLDLVILPNGDVFLLDEDELDQAYRTGVIGQEDYDLAQEQVDLVLEEVADDLEGLEAMSRKYLDYMKE